MNSEEKLAFTVIGIELAICIIVSVIYARDQYIKGRADARAEMVLATSKIIEDLELM